MIKSFDDFHKQQVNEGLKEWIISAALSTAALSAKSQETSPLDIYKKNISAKEWATQKQKNFKADTLELDFGSDFESGDYRFNNNKSDSIRAKLEKIGAFIMPYKNNDISIKIVGSESKVPNRDIVTGKRLPPGGLAKLRVDQTQKLVTDYMQGLTERGFFKAKFDTSTMIGGPRYISRESPAQQKFKEHQFVKVYLVINAAFDKRTELFAAYATFSEGLWCGDHRIGEIYVTTRSTEDLSKQGGITWADRNLVLLKTMKSTKQIIKEMEAGNKNPDYYDGRLYLIPEDELRKMAPLNRISKEDLEIIKSKYELEL